ncbi:MAG TPA: beta-ketoacyl synthase N-terminal-like domain-containing protein [Candidatus Wallbacteria bacterium]|nr:beta-ketoacyl synthase N-terminal-like domain-containing protein [Candidatus Wallbacteria bacterium]
MNAHKRVVITGVGMINPCGASAGAFLAAVESGRCCVSEADAETAGEISCRYCGKIKDFDPASFLKNKKSAKFMGRDSLLGIYAAGAALRDARVEADADFLQNAGVYVSSGLTCGTLGDILPAVEDSICGGAFSLEVFGKRSLYKCNPLLSFKILTNMPASFISIEFGLKGPNLIFNPYSAQGAQAVGEAFEAVSGGVLRCALAGSSESRLHYAASGTADEIAGIYKGGTRDGFSPRPLDRERAGIIPSEGSAFIVMESFESAVERKAHIYAEVAAYSQANIASAELASDSMKRCMETACEKASVQPEDIGLVVSGAAGSVKKDEAEGIALESFFKNTRSLIFTPKYYYGEMGAPAFATGLVLGAMFLDKKLSPPAAEESGCEFKISRAGYSLAAKKIKYAMINAFEAGTTAACLIIKGVEHE